MLLLNSWILLAFVPLYFLYKRSHNQNRQTKLLYLSLVFLLLALSRPALENSFVHQKFTSQEYIIALDASYSMQANDLKPSRYALAKQAIKKLLSLHIKDRFTLFLFTSNTLLISPPTTDTAISMQALESINPLYILTKSTDLAQLFSTIKKLPIEHKNLILFTDGGEEHNLPKLVKLLKEANITPYIVATATQKGAALTKDEKYLKNPNGSLVISKINPTLKDLATATQGKYYELSSTDTMHALSDALSKNSTQEADIKVKTYQELFFVPLVVGMILFLFALTKLSKILKILPLFLLFSQTSKASLLDFYHLQEANEAYTQANFSSATQEFLAVTPSVKIYYNLATAYYKAGEYKKALFFYTQIQTKQKDIKQKIFYNMANTAVKLKQYDKAKELYIKALLLGQDADALYNLNLLKKRHLKSAFDAKKLLAKKQQTQKKSNKKKKNSSAKKNKKNSGNSQSNNSASQTSRGSGGDKKLKKQAPLSKKQKKKDNYKLSYKVYEKINKGYLDEKEPW